MAKKSRRPAQARPKASASTGGGSDATMSGSEAEGSGARLTAAQRVEQRRADRSRGRSAAAASRRKQKRMRQIAYGIVGVIALAVVVVFAYQRITHTEVGESVSDAGRTHIANEMTGTGYTSDPPTSGPHWASVAPWGVHSEPIPNELQIHNLEHGGVVMQYDCEDEECPEIVAALEGLAGSCSVKLISAPRPGMDQRIAVTAWTRIIKMDELDRDLIVDFINAYADRGPERFPSETAAWNRCDIS